MGAIFGSILSSILGALAGPLTDKIADVAKAYINKEISQAEFDAQVKTAILACFSSVEATWAEASTKQFEAFQETLRGTPMIQRAYVAVIVSQLFVLVWYQFFASAFLLLAGRPWPSPGTTIDWAYLLLSVAIGGGALAFRQPGGGVLDSVGAIFSPKT